MNKKSYEAHNAEYELQNKFEQEKIRHENSTKEKAEFREDCPLGEMILKYPEIKVGVDIGAGTGWAANLLSETKDVVYAIEPSSAAIEIGKKLNPNNTKIKWLNGFAQEFISKLPLEGPAIFNSLCVLSHLENYDVVEICEQIDKVAKIGSVLSFSECYGCDYSDGNLWHVREENWWKAQFPSWNFIFNGPPINHPVGARKSFAAVKVAERTIEKNTTANDEWLQTWLEE